MEQESVTQKIASLLNLAHAPSATKHEAENAMAAAQRIAAKHHIDLTTVGTPSAAKARIMEATAMPGLVLSPWRRMLAGTVCHNFGCIALVYEGELAHGESRLSIVGTETNLEIVGRVLMFALEVGEQELRRYIMGAGSLAYNARERLKNEWANGYAIGIQHMFDRQVAEDECVALMVMDNHEVQDYVNEHLDVDMKQRHYHGDQSSPHFREGYVVGRTTHLGPELRIGDTDDQET